MAVKNSLEIIIAGFERGGRIRVTECLRQIVPDSWARIRKNLSPNVFAFTRGVTKFRLLYQIQIVIVLLEYKVEGDRTDTEGLFQRWS